MGTDINLYAERCEDHRWVPVPEPRVESWSEGQPVPVEPLETGRPYGLFSVLAGGSIGLSSFKLKVPFVSKPRGLPPGTRQVFWSTPLREYVGCADEFLGTLESLGPPDKVRIIYDFSC